MDVQQLKEHILDNNLVPTVLEAINCHHIVPRGSYISAGNPDGDNTSAINVYLNENLTTIDYTRDILPNGQSRSADLIDLVCYFRECNFIETLRFLCELFSISYYHTEEEIPESLQILQLLNQMGQECENDDAEDTTPVQPINKHILDYYMAVGNDFFKQDGISLSTQRFFEIGYDPQSNYITIPIYSEIGDLVGVKGRIFETDLSKVQNKYVYLEPTNKGKILYGLDKNLSNIISQGKVFVVESEKGVMQLFDMGYYAVATGGAKISRYQINMLTRLGVKIIFAYDEDIDEEQLSKIANRFAEGVPVYAIIDKEHILKEKESPSDNVNKWINLVGNHIYQIK